MNDLLKALYDTFYKPPKMTETLSEIKSIHQQLVEQLDKPARRLVLKLVDDEEKIADELSLDSFIAGFQMAWQLAAEVMWGLPPQENCTPSASVPSGNWQSARWIF